MNHMKRILTIIVCLTFGLFNAFAQNQDEIAIHVEGDSTTDNFTLYTDEFWTADDMSFYCFYLVATDGNFYFKIQHHGLLYDDEKAVCDKYAGKRITANIEFESGFTANYDVGIEHTEDPEGFFQGLTISIYSPTGDTKEVREQSTIALVKENIKEININGSALIFSKRTALYFLKLASAFNAIKH